MKPKYTTLFMPCEAFDCSEITNCSECPLYDYRYSDLTIKEIVDVLEGK
jgi:hypothetical protein